MTPRQWRKGAGLSMAKVAELVGVKGAANPARTWMRWELGAREPPLSVVAKVEEMSGGMVTSASWASLSAQHGAAA